MSSMPSDHVRFVTYTTRFNKAYWVTVDGLDEIYNAQRWTQFEATEKSTP